MSGKIFVWLLTTVLLTTAPVAQAQQPKKVPRIGFLSSRSPDAAQRRLAAFQQGLQELGYVVG